MLLILNVTILIMISENDIMVGDYLQNINGNVGKVVSIEHYYAKDKVYYEVVMQYHKNGTAFSSPKMLNPVSLTAEALEKNGFEYKNGIWVKKGPVRLGWYEKKKELIIGYHTMPIIVEFVHTLQHIIRLLGLEEDIVL